MDGVCRVLALHITYPCLISGVLQVTAQALATRRAIPA